MARHRLFIGGSLHGQWHATVDVTVICPTLTRTGPDTWERGQEVYRERAFGCNRPYPLEMWRAHYMVLSTLSDDEAIALVRGL
jgi:hypothetical protein